MQVDFEDVGLGKLQPLPVRVRELCLIRPHQPARQQWGAGRDQRERKREARRHINRTQAQIIDRLRDLPQTTSLVL